MYYSRTIKAYVKVGSCEGSIAYVYYNRAVLKRKMGCLDEVEKYVNLGLMYDPQHNGLRKLHEGRLRQEFKDAEKAAEIVNAGLACMESGDNADAANHFTQALVLDPTKFLFLRYRIVANLNLQSWPDVEKDCTEALSRFVVDETQGRDLVFLRAFARFTMSRWGEVETDVKNLLEAERVCGDEVEYAKYKDLSIV